METIKFNATEKVGTAKNISRMALLEILRAAAIEARGEDMVTQVADGEFSVCMGIYDGEELCINVAPTAKEPVDRKTEKKEFVAYNRLAAGEAYQEKLAEREKKKAEKKSSTETTED